MMAFTGWGYPGSAFDASDKPALWNFIERRLGLTRARPTPPIDAKTIAVPASRLDAASAEALRALLGAENFTTDGETRLLHSFGKSYRDLLRARRGEIGRVPDAVAFPESAAQVAEIFAVARSRRLKVIPFGGGTNIVGGVEPSPAWDGGVLTVSLRRMNRLLALDEISQVATLEAGALGPELEAALNARGWTLGHFPDSFEYSTLGGWLATRSAGMQSDARGKIEDMVVALTCVTPAGTIETRAVPRGATGPDLNQLLVGSEGIFGIITSATMRVHRLATREYRGLLMPDFATGVEFMQRCWREGVPPSTMRLSNPEETQLSFTLKSPGSAWSRWFSAAAKTYLRVGRGFDFERVCLMIVGWEGAAEDVARRRDRALALARECNAFDAGVSAGDSWFARKYEYPLLRDLIMDIGGMADVTEASVLWKDALPVYEKVNAGLRQAVARDGVPGYIGCHLSHVYAHGVCLYFTFAAAREPGNELAQYLRLKKLAVDLLVSSGASLSHHHSIGYEHLPWMRDYAGAPALAAWRGVKAALDPDNLCNPGKLLPSAESALEHYWPGWKSAAPNDNAP
ncbi:MAG TPA: FAD-binding oxidoreductase [Opitutaceae bacterium]|nr:FAD-binding oxidoreductase [Opitutaceae bacterium]